MSADEWLVFPHNVAMLQVLGSATAEERHRDVRERSADAGGGAGELRAPHGSGGSARSSGGCTAGGHPTGVAASQDRRDRGRRRHRAQPPRVAGGSLVGRPAGTFPPPPPPGRLLRRGGLFRAGPRPPPPP